MFQECGGKPEGRVSDLAAGGFGHNSSSYETHRPGYTPQAVSIIGRAVAAVAAVGDATRYTVLELGAGTGKLTEQLVKELTPTSRYLAVDPSRNFLAALEEKSLGVETVVASAAQLPVAAQSVQAVVCAQSFHWFSDPDSLRSIHRVLAPGGILVLIWNKENLNNDWRQKIFQQRLQIKRRIGANTSEIYYTGEWKNHIDRCQLFSLREYHDLPGVEFRGSLEKILSHEATISCYNALPPDEKEAYMEDLRAVLISWPGLDPSDMEIPYTTELYVYVA
ncbi:hypothetical protein EGW08_003848 [Elysia chlorotica]|uniref:Methyltransferase domain-containing protein n=1 Tax=Elysia chlorotica TaxID=188477 RepID=A0A3S0ZXG0_ELYCH|nr:hypothetical protein EGW08_003848 [Elysia chlorotica]